MLVIEIDGITHQDKFDKDIIRQNKLESLGIHFLRFSDKDIKQNIDQVLFVIRQWIDNCDFKKK